MAKKEFERKYMHPTRKKLVDMVFNKEYDKNSSVGGFHKQNYRKVGDIWEDEHYVYEKKEGYTTKTSKKTETNQKIREYLQNVDKCKHSECQKTKYSPNDKKMIRKIGYCIDCNAKVETHFQFNGLLKEYRDYRTYTRMLVWGNQKLEEIKQAKDTVKQEYEYVNSDGSTQKWELPRPVEDVKAEMQEMIDNSIKEIKEVEERRNKVFERIKEKNCEHLL